MAFKAKIHSHITRYTILKCLISRNCATLNVLAKCSCAHLVVTERLPDWYSVHVGMV